MLEPATLPEFIVLLHGFLSEEAVKEACALKGAVPFVMEGRPQLLTSRWLCRLLNRRGIKPTLIADNMAGFLFYKNLVKEVHLAYQAGGEEEALCPTGSLILAVLARKHHVPVIISEAVKPLEYLGQSKDVEQFNGVRVAARGVSAYVPLVEAVPHKYLTRIVS